MNNKLILEELFRMREIMGISLSETIKNKINSVLLLEGGKAADEFLPIGPKSVDNLTKQGVDFANDLSILSDEFTNLGIKTFDDLTKVVASKNPTIDPKNITDDMIKSYIKNDDKLYKSILSKAAAAAAAEAVILVKNADLTDLFKADPVQLANIQRLLGATPGIRTVDTLIQGVDDSITSLEKTIDDIQMGNVPGVTTLPRELEELYDQLITKKLDLTNYKNKDVTPESVKFPEPDDLITDDVAENVISNPTSTINQIFDAIIKNRKIRREIAPSLKDEDFAAIRRRLVDRYGDLSMKDLMSRYDQVILDAKTMLKNAQRVIDNADRGIVKEGTDPNKYRTLNNIGNFLYDNQLTRACIGTAGKNRQTTVGFTGAGYKIPLCALGLLFIGDILSWVMTPKTERDFIGCNMLGTLGLCSTFTEYGFCEKSCSESTEPIIQKVYDNTADDFAKWVTDNNFSNPDYEDEVGYTYKDGDGDRQLATYDPKQKTFN